MGICRVYTGLADNGKSNGQELEHGMETELDRDVRWSTILCGGLQKYHVVSEHLPLSRLTRNLHRPGP